MGKMKNEEKNKSLQNGMITQPDSYFRAAAMESSTPGFAFKKRLEHVDWRKIAAVDIESISRNLRFDILQENIQHLTFCNIEAELDMRQVEPSFVKLFRLAQLTIEYLLHSQDYLSETAGCLEKKLSASLKEQEQAEGTLKKIHEELAESKKECHRRKKMLATQQQLIQAGANAYNKCPYCAKAFINAGFLQAHVSRRHAHVDAAGPARFAQSAQADIGAPEPTVLEQELRSIRKQLIEERDVRRLELEATKKDQACMETKMKLELEAWGREQREMQKSAMSRVEDLFMKELREQNEKTNAAERMNVALKRKLGGGSNLGRLEDCDEDEVQARQREQAQVTEVKEMLQTEVNKVHTEMETMFHEQEREWKERLRAMSISHQHQLREMNTALENSAADLQKEKQERGEMSAVYKNKLKEHKLLLKKQDEIRQKAAVERPARMGLSPPRGKVPSGGMRLSPPRGKVPSGGKQQAKPRSPRSRQPAPSKLAAKETMKHEETPVIPIMAMGSDEEDSTEFDATTTMGTGTLPTLGTETLSWRETRNSRLLDQMKRNPAFLADMKTRIRSLVESEMERRGIPPGMNRLSNAVFESKLTLLNRERQQRAKRFRNFYDIRRQYDVELEQRMQQANNSNAATASAAPGVSGSRSLPRFTSTPKGHGGAMAPPRGASSLRTPPAAPPRPAPRTTSPPPRPDARPGARLDDRQDGRQDGRPAVDRRAEILQSSHWASESYTDEDEDEDDDEEEDDDEFDGDHVVDYPATQVAAQRQRVMGDDGSGSEWDSGSELQEVKRTPRGAASHNTNQNHNSVSVRQPKGKMVAALTKSIGYQLQTRSGKKLPGAINTLTGEETAASGRISHNSNGSLDDRDLFTVSSEDESELSGNVQRRRSAARTNGHPQVDTDTSTNTLGTSAWGSSRATPHAVGGASVGKSSLASVSDWDNLEDI